MKTLSTIAAIAVGAALVTSCQHKPTSPSVSDMKWIDLTWSFDSTTLYWPNNKGGFVHKKDFKGVNTMGFFYASFQLNAPEHGGTHLDAPVHFAEGRRNVDEIPLQNLVGPGVVIDVSKAALENRDYQISVADLEQWEQKHGAIPDSSIVLFRTGYGAFYPDRTKYFGTPDTGMVGVKELHFPGIHPDAAKWLAEQRKPRAVGLDTPSLDYGQSTLFESHRTLLGNNIPGFENVAHLDALPETGSWIVALPMKIKEGSGAPLRITAAIPKN
jgi:kynurenine formamidase